MKYSQNELGELGYYIRKYFFKDYIFLLYVSVGIIIFKFILQRSIDISGSYVLCGLYMWDIKCFELKYWM